MPLLHMFVALLAVGYSTADATYMTSTEYYAADTRVRYHVNGSQYIDERVATFTVASGQFAYYLGSNNFSITGTGNADGSMVERLDYSSTGDFAGGGPGASTFYHDADDDLDIDLRDFANFQNCFDPTPPVLPACAPIHDFDTTDASDGDIDLNDYARFVGCSNGPFVTPDQACGIPQRAGVTPTSGVFALHGRPVDILSDGHSLLDFRARNYSPTLGRWLQRDPVAYSDSFNLYESFLSNPLSNIDPTGEGLVTCALVGDCSLSDLEFIRQGGLGQAIRGFFGGGAQAAGNVAIGAAKGARELGYVVVDIVVAPVDIASTLVLNEPLGRPLSQVGQAATNPNDLGRLIATTGSRNVLNAVSLGAFNVVEGTVIYVQTGDEQALAQNVGGQGLLTLGTVGAVRVVSGPGVLSQPATTRVAAGGTSAVRIRVLANIAESRAARAASRFEVFAGEERALGVPRVEAVTATTDIVPFFPQSRGFLGQPQRVFLQKGQRIDRFGGSPFSRFFSPAGTPVGARALPPGTDIQLLRTFEVLRPFEVEAGTVAPAFGQLGLGTQFRSFVTLQELVDLGFIREVVP